MYKFPLLFVLSAAFTNYVFDWVYNAHITGSLSKLFTIEELSTYNGDVNSQLYLSILGNVFDVTEGKQYYGPGESYHSFIGKDISRSFVTGDFNADTSSDDVISLKNSDLRALNHWVKFYKKQYKKVGKLLGRFYNDKGKLTPYGKEVKMLIKAAEEASANEDLEKLKFPPCNAEWNADTGSRVWCTKKSGGIDRDWVGVPRQLYEPGAESFRCACIYDGNERLGNIKEYEGCNPTSDSCDIKNSNYLS